MGANIAGFEKVANAMMAQGLSLIHILVAFSGLLLLCFVQESR